MTSRPIPPVPARLNLGPLDWRAGNPILLVVDMQNGFLSREARYVIANVQKLVERWTEEGREVIFTRFINRSGSPHEQLLGWTRLRESPEIDICDELQRFAKTVIDKVSYGALTPELAGLLEQKKCKVLILSGVATDGCILKTAIDAFDLGMTPVVVKDACASHAGREVHEIGLILLRRFIGERQIMTINELFDQGKT